VLHHGFAADVTTNWVLPGIIAALVDDGRTVIALDARGHGRSDKPHDPAAYGHHVMSRDVSALLDHLGTPSVDLCGYSMGGYVTAITAARGEPRLRSAVIGGIGAAALSMEGVDRSAVADALIAEDPASVTDTTARQFRRFAESTGADRRALSACMRAPFRPVGDLSAVRVPVLVAVGEADQLATHPEVLAAAIPGARLVVTPGDHLGAVGQPEYRAAIVAFLHEVDRT
jgi:pimeloyl-ACP methyl ester carboxylesterase